MMDKIKGIYQLFYAESVTEDERNQALQDPEKMKQLISDKLVTIKYHEADEL